MIRSIDGRARNKIQWLSGDYNGDGRTDIAFYDARDGKWWVAENYRDNTLGFKLNWKLYQVFQAPAQALFGHDRFSGDFNGDGFSDILIFDRSNGQWWLGQTTSDANGNSTINFQMWSTIPNYSSNGQNITRWLQGDFNGDGRTDIGYYSQADNKFWIGESTSTGFRYRVYNDLSFGGPDAARVMATPLPQDEVIVKENSTYQTFGLTPGNTRQVSYSYDGNTSTTHGEIPFVGCFTGLCSGGSELLIYDKARGLFTFKGTGQTVSDTGITFTNTLPDSKIITESEPVKNVGAGNNSEVWVYEADAANHNIKRIYHNGSTFVKNSLASFPRSGGAIVNFDINESLYLVANFTGSGSPDALILNDQAGVADFQLFNGTTNATLSINAPPGLNFKEYLSQDH